MIEQASVALCLFGSLFGLVAVCHHVAWWSARTPRSGYLVLAVFALYLLTRSLP